MGDGLRTGADARSGIDRGRRQRQVLHWHWRAGVVTGVAVILIAASGCSVILRALGIPVDGPRSLLRAGTYSGAGECDVLVQLEGGGAVPDVVSLSLEVVVDGRGQPQRNGTAFETDGVADLEVGPFNLELTVTGLVADRDTFLVSMDGAVVVDADTGFPIEMSGAAAETFERESDGTLTYGLAVNLAERDDTGAVLETTMAVQCDVVLERE